MTRSEIGEELTKALGLVTALRVALAATEQASEDHVFEGARDVALKEARELARRYVNPSLGPDS